MVHLDNVVSGHDLRYRYVYLSLCCLTCVSLRTPAVPRPLGVWFLGHRALALPLGLVIRIYRSLVLHGIPIPLITGRSLAVG